MLLYNQLLLGRYLTSQKRHFFRDLPSRGDFNVTAVFSLGSSRVVGFLIRLIHPVENCLENNLNFFLFSFFLYIGNANIVIGWQFV